MMALEAYKALEALHRIEDKIRTASQEALLEHGHELRRAGRIEELAQLRRALLLDEIMPIAVLKKQLQEPAAHRPWWMLRWLASPFFNA